MSTSETKTPHSPKWRNLVVTGFAVCVIVLLVLAFVVGGAIVKLRNGDSARNARREAHELFASFSDAVNDTQVAHYEALLVGPDRAGKALGERLARVRELRPQLQELIEQSPELASHQPRLGQLLDAWLTELDEQTRVQRERGSAAAMAGVQSRTSPAAIDSLSDELDAINRVVLAAERASGEAVLDFSRLVLICGLGLAVTIALMILLAIQYLSDAQARRRQAEAQAAQQRMIQQRRQLLVQYSPLGVIVWNTDFTVREWNPAAERIFGYSTSEAMGMPARSLVPESAREMVDELWAKLLRGTGGTRSRNGNVTKSGERRTIEWYNQTLLDEQGKTIGVMSLCQDVTEEEAAQAKVQHAYGRYKRAADGAFDGVWEFDYRTGQLDATDRLYEIYGLAPGTAVPPSYWPEHTHPDDMPAYRKALAEHIEGRTQIIDAEYRIRLPDGRYRWVRSRGRVIKDESGRPALLSGSTRDIDERMAAERKNKRDADFIRSVLGTTQVGITVTDPQGRFTYVNPTAADRLGASPQELAGIEYFKIPWKYFDFDGRPLSIEQTPHAMVMATGKPVWGVEMTLEHPDGRELMLSANAAPLRGPDGAIEAVIVSLDDITEREMARRQQQALEAELQHARRIEAIGTLASGVAHDLNNVLSAIYACLDGARASATKPAELKRYLSLIEQAASGAGEINQALLTYARKDGPRPLEPINLTRQIEVAMRLLMRLLPPNVRLDLKLCPEELWVMGDSGRIQQVLLNLVVNARDAMASGGTLTVRLSGEANGSAPAGALLEVLDTGEGIEPAIREQIFEPFFTTKPRGKGTGLGLAVVQGVVQSMHGTIDLRSMPGHGACFAIRLPGIVPPVTQVAKPAAIAATVEFAPRQQAIVAERDPFVRSLITTAMRSLSLIPTEVDTLAQARDEVRRMLPSVRVVVVDAPGEDESSIEPVEALRAIDPHVGVILLVGEQSGAAPAEQFPGVRVLRRPFRMQALRQAVEELADWFVEKA